MARYLVLDLETDKVHVFTGGKADWLSLPQADRDVIKRNCLWSKARGCWVSRAKIAHTGLLRETLGRLGFEGRGTVGKSLTFAEQVAAKQEKAEDRAERMEGRAADAHAEAHARFNSPHVETLRSLQGEPVKIGHHSQRRHERLIERADNDMRAGVDALGKRDHYQRRAEAARATAEGAQYSDPGYLGRRVREVEADLRDVERKVERAKDGTDQEWLARLYDLRDQGEDKLGFLRHCLETCGRKVWDRESLRGMREVFVRGEWEPIVRLNPTTVAVPNRCYPDEVYQAKYAFKRPYTEVRDAR